MALRRTGYPIVCLYYLRPVTPSVSYCYAVGRLCPIRCGAFRAIGTLFCKTMRGLLSLSTLGASPGHAHFRCRRRASGRSTFFQSVPSCYCTHACDRSLRSVKRDQAEIPVSRHASPDSIGIRGCRDFPVSTATSPNSPEAECVRRLRTMSSTYSPNHVLYPHFFHSLDKANCPIYLLYVRTLSPTRHQQWPISAKYSRI